MADLLIRFRHPGLALILGALLIWSSCSPAEAPPLKFEVLVDEALGLREQAPVRTDAGEVLGRVTALRKTETGTILSLELDSTYRGKLSRAANFEIVGTATGGELRLGEAFGTPAVEDGARIDARLGWLDRLARGIGEWEGRTRELIGGAGSMLGDFLKDLSQSPEAQRLKDSIEELGRDIATVTRARAQRFVATELPQLEEKARQHRDKLISDGRDTEAEVFWKWFQRWAQTMRGDSESLPAESEENSRPAEKPPGSATRPNTRTGSQRSFIGPQTETETDEAVGFSRRSPAECCGLPPPFRFRLCRLTSGRAQGGSKLQHSEDAKIDRARPSEETGNYVPGPARPPQGDLELWPRDPSQDSCNCR